MPRERISCGFATNLQNLLEGEVLNGSAFGNQRLLENMLEDRVLARTVTGRNRSKIRCPDPVVLNNYLRLQFGIVELEIYLDLLGKEARDGEESLQATTSTKVLRTKSLQGFFIKAYGVEIKIGDDPLGNLPNGAEYFVHNPDSLKIPSRVPIVGVENPECFIKAERLLTLFPETVLIFVLRYYSNRLTHWLKTIGNPYLHFGDFDPAGISIYCNEYLSVLGKDRCRFFVPEGIEKLVADGDTGLFDRQAHQWPPKAEIHQPELLELISLINRYAKGCEQEKLLELSMQS